MGAETAPLAQLALSSPSVSATWTTTPDNNLRTTRWRRALAPAKKWPNRGSSCSCDARLHLVVLAVHALDVCAGAPLQGARPHALVASPPVATLGCTVQHAARSRCGTSAAVRRAPLRGRRWRCVRHARHARHRRPVGTGAGAAELPFSHGRAPALASFPPHLSAGLPTARRKSAPPRASPIRKVLTSGTGASAHRRSRSFEERSPLAALLQRPGCCSSTRRQAAPSPL